MNCATYVSSVTLHVIYNSLSLWCLECTTEGTEKRKSHPEDGEEVATFKKTIAPFASESVSPPPGSDDETTKEDQKYLRKLGKQRK